METVPRSQNHLAELLGISKGAASKQAGRGMPTHSLEAATAWRKTHINPAAIKGSRFDQFYKHSPSRKLAEPSILSGEFAEMLLAEPEQTAPEPDWFQLAAAVLDVADDLLQANQSIDCIIPKLRAAMACVPLSERPVLPLPLNVIEVLVADVMALLPPQKDNPLNEDGTPVWCNGDDMSETEADDLGAFWYQVAAGEVRLK